jgi:hypothetical protein
VLESSAEQLAFAIEEIASSFLLVMLLILASGGVTLALLFWRRLL